MTPLPTGGAYVAFILNILQGYNFTADSIATAEDEIQTYHRFTEAFKFGKMQNLHDSMRFSQPNAICFFSVQ